MLRFNGLSLFTVSVYILSKVGGVFVNILLWLWFNFLVVLFSFVHFYFSHPLYYSRGGARAPQAGLGGILRRERAGQVLVQQAHRGGQLDAAAVLELGLRLWRDDMWCVLVCSGRGVSERREGGCWRWRFGFVI